jgi:hypothetical protein
MSSESSVSPTGDPAGQLFCTFCDCSLTEQLLALQSYSAAGVESPAAIPDHGGLTLCPDCASEVVELLSAWHRHGQPPVDGDRSIGDWYEELADACSFCTDAIDSNVLGIELYRRVGDELPAYANYTLCADCQSVFGEFLGNVKSS